MCDTVIASGSVTADGITILGKNSDREPNEAHHVVRIPRQTHAPGSTVKCTYVEVPQVEETYEVLLAKPFWIWGAEMGSNEHGVTIGNEAVFTKIPYQKDDGMIGMDFLRLALERAKTARAALDVITGLLETYGQSGNCGFTHKLYYHNSFIIADPLDAWVLETAGKHWAAEQVKGIRTISNGITIGNEWDLASDDLVAYAVDKGWCKGRDDFHFGRCYSDFLFTKFGDCKKRQQCTTDLLNAQQGKITPKTVMDVLRNHGSDDYSPAFGITGIRVCAHAGFGPIRSSQTTGSMASVLGKDVQTHFVTGTAAPCTSVFKPLWLGADLPDMGTTPTGTYDETSLFWKHEVLHRATMRNHAELLALYAGERETLEDDFIGGAMACAPESPEKRAAYSAECFTRAAEAEAEWTGRVQSHDSKTSQGPLYRLAWRNANRDAKITDKL